MSETVDIVIEYEKEHRASIGALLASIKANRGQNSIYHIYLWGVYEDKAIIQDEEYVTVQWIDKKNSQNVQLGKIIFLKWNTLVLGDLTDLYNINIEYCDYGAAIDFPGNICYLPESSEKYNNAVLLIEFSKLYSVLERCTDESTFEIKDISIFFNLDLEGLLDKQDRYNSNALMEKGGFSKICVSYLLQRAVIVRLNEKQSAEKYFDGILSELWLKYYKMSPFGQQILRRKSYVETHGEIQLNDWKKSIPLMLTVEDDNVAYAMALIYSLKAGLEDGQQLDIRVTYYILSESHKRMILSVMSDNVSIILFNVQFLVENSPCYYVEMLIAGIFDEYEKVLYLDTKQICVDAIGKLYDLDIGNCYALAAPKQVWGKCPVKAEDAREQLLGNAPYVDTSVFLVNTEKWLQEELTGKIWAFASARKNEKISYEKIFNFMCRDQIGLLPDCWHELWSTRFKSGSFNDQDGLYQYIRYRERFFMIHYNGDVNPWNESESVETRLLYKYIAMSGYYEQLIEEASCYGEKSGIMDVGKIEKLEKEKNDLLNRIGQLENELNQVRASSNQYLYELTETRKSFTYKVGRFITWLPRKLKHH